jgi:hypothetical protein
MLHDSGEQLIGVLHGRHQFHAVDGGQECPCAFAHEVVVFCEHYAHRTMLQLLPGDATEPLEAAA